MTNFERITKSPESLAEFLEKLGDCFSYQELGICPDDRCRCEPACCENAALEWLQEEADA